MKKPLLESGFFVAKCLDAVVYHFEGIGVDPDEASFDRALEMGRAAKGRETLATLVGHAGEVILTINRVDG